MDILQLFERKAQQLFWGAIDASHLAGVPAPQAIEKNAAYFVVRVTEMYLASARKLWREVYPVLHCYTQCGNLEQNGLAGPNQLEPLGDANLDRIINLNQRLAGPTPYTGDEVSILAGLYAAPGHDLAKAVIDVLSAFAAFNPVIAQAEVVANAVKTGIEDILGLDEVVLQLGVRDTFNPASQPFCSGYYAGISVPATQVDVSQLWVSGGRLLKGKDAASATPYSDHDYMLLAIERLDARPDWRQLPELADSQHKFASVITDIQFTTAEKRQRLAALWPAFIEALQSSANLTDPDRDGIARSVAQELLKRLDAEDSGNPFIPKAA
jgi:hypothetical protein